MHGRFGARGEVRLVEAHERADLVQPAAWAPPEVSERGRGRMKLRF